MFTKNETSVKASTLKMYLPQALVLLYCDSSPAVAAKVNAVQINMTVSAVQAGEETGELLADMFWALIHLSYNWGKTNIAESLLAAIPPDNLATAPHLQTFEAYLPPAGSSPLLPLVSPRMQQIFDLFKDKPDYAESLQIHYQTLQVMLAAGCSVNAYAAYKVALSTLPRAFSLSDDDVKQGLISMALQAGYEELDVGFAAKVATDLPPDFVSKVPEDVLTFSVRVTVMALILGGISTELLNGADDKARLIQQISAMPALDLFTNLAASVFNVPRNWPAAPTVPMPPSIGHLPLMDCCPLIVIQQLPDAIGFAKAPYGSDKSVSGVPGVKISFAAFNTMCNDIKAENVVLGMVMEFSHYWLVNAKNSKAFIRLPKQEKPTAVGDK